MWLPIPGYPDYDVSDEGQVRSRRRKKERILKPRPHKGGYGLIRLYDTNSEWADFTVHSLVMLAFKGECPEGQCIRHLNSDPTDNSLSNLAYGTPAENQEDRIDAGTYGMKLTVEKVKTIRAFREFGLTYQQLAKIFSVSRICIRRVIRRQTWAFVD